MKGYNLTKDAQFDLNEIWEYSATTWSVDQANNYHKLLTKEFETIAQNPQRGKLRNHLKHGYRSAQVKSHLIFYKQTNENTVEIVRILHQSMDFEKRLTEEKTKN